MANQVNFYELVVGKRYWMYSRYWMDVNEVEIIRSGIWNGRAAYVENGVKTDREFCADPEWSFFFDDRPTREECDVAQKRGYTPPRTIRGVCYNRKEWEERLDILASNLKKTFETGFGNEELLSENDLDYEISGLLILGNGRPDWDSMRYLNKYGFKVGPGEVDSFGWLTGVITKIGVKNKGIVFG